MNTGGRPVGKHIRAICAWLEQHGPQTSRQIAEGTGFLIESVGRGTVRARTMGFISSHGKPLVHSVIPGWEGRTERGKHPRLIPVQKTQPITTAPVNSVWQLGQVAAALVVTGDEARLVPVLAVDLEAV